MAEKITLPGCGMFFGVPVYIDRGDYVFQTTGPFYTSWVSEDHDPAWYVKKAKEDNQGNLLILWDGGATRRCLKSAACWLALEELGYRVPDPDWENGRFLTPEDYPPIREHWEERYGAGFYQFVRDAADKGFHVYSIYSNANPDWVEKIVKVPQFLGYNAGEAFSFGTDPEESEEEEEGGEKGNTEKSAVSDSENLARNGEGELQEKKMCFRKEMTLETVAERFAQNIREYFAVRRKQGWNRFLVTSASFHVDFEIAAGGSDIIPHVEGFAFRNLNFGMSICRGLYRQCGLPLWGCYLAHEHYSFLPYASPLKKMTLDASHYLACLNGSKITVQESGSWWQQSDHVEDTPMHDTPKFDAGHIQNNNPHDYRKLIPEARKHYPLIGYDSRECRMYRKSVSDFYDYLKQNGAPEGQPEVRIAALKGRFDFCSQSYEPNCAVAGAYAIAEKNPRWYESQPERSWEIFRKVFHPLNDSFGDYKNFFFSGTPYGMTDIVSFSAPLSADFLSENYRALLFTGWNSAEEAQYDILLDYVRRGGILFAAIPHFSGNLTRDGIAYKTEELIRGGDFRELCGVRVKKRGRQFYWVLTAGNNSLGSFPRNKRFGAFCTHLGEIEMESGVEVLVHEDEQFLPLLLRHRCGKGEVYFLNSWEYPGAYDSDWAPGSLRSSPGLVGEIYKSIALRCRGSAYITDDGILPGNACCDITFACYPQAKEVLLMNCNFASERTFLLHAGGKETRLTLAPAEFRSFRY